MVGRQNSQQWELLHTVIARRHNYRDALCQMKACNYELQFFSITYRKLLTLNCFIRQHQHYH